ncbi:MAG: HAD hydrolase-like protein, partial [Calditrichia bacterium]
EKLIEKYDDSRPYLTIAKSYLSAPELKDYRQQIDYFTQKHRFQYIRLIPGIKATLTSLFHYYSLGIITNYAGDTEWVLKKMNLRHFFKVLAMREQLNTAMPDREIFLGALTKSKAAPDQAIMIGSNLNVTILPAKKLGMFTIQTKLDNRGKGILPQNDREKLFFESRRKMLYREEKSLFQRPQPHAIVRRAEDILKIINAMETNRVMPEEAEPQEEDLDWKDVLKELFQNYFVMA